MASPKTPDYAMVTVRLTEEDQKLSKQEQFAAIKGRLNIPAPDMDQNYFIPLPEVKKGRVQKAKEAVVLIETSVALKLKADKHPSIIGVFSNPKIDPAAPNPTKEWGWCGTPPAPKKKGPGR